MQPNPITHIINNILPKERKESKDDDIRIYSASIGWNKAIVDCRAKLPEIINYVYAELRKEVESLPNATRNECYDEKVICASEVLSLLSTNQK